MEIPAKLTHPQRLLDVSRDTRGCSLRSVSVIQLQATHQRDSRTIKTIGTKVMVGETDGPLHLLAIGSIDSQHDAGLLLPFKRHAGWVGSELLTAARPFSFTLRFFPMGHAPLC